MTNAGEYLLSLPQHLEAIAEAAEEEKDAATVAATAAAVAAAAGDDQAATVAVANNPPALDDVEPELEAGEWMSKVAEAASGLLLAEVRAIPALTEPGAAQLAADLEYFTNIVTALSLEPPAALRTYAVCAATARDSYGISVREDTLEGRRLDEDVVRAVASLRGIPLD